MNGPVVANPCDFLDHEKSPPKANRESFTRAQREEDTIYSCKIPSGFEENTVANLSLVVNTMYGPLK